MRFSTALTAALMACGAVASPLYKRAIVTVYNTVIVTEVAQAPTQVYHAPVVWETVTAGVPKKSSKPQRKKPVVVTYTPTPAPSPTPAPVYQAPEPEPVYEAPAVEEPVKEEPAKEEPVKEEPVKEEPVVETPAEDESTGGDEEAAAPATGSTGSDWKDAVLAMHNKLRAKHGAAALTWDTELESHAQGHVNQCRFEHTQNLSYGENLAACTGEMKPAEQIESGWYEGEIGDYNGVDSSNGVGHFTQVVWKETTKLGCAMKVCGGGLSSNDGPVFGGGQATILTCNYNPPGNYAGEFSINVQL